MKKTLLFFVALLATASMAKAQYVVTSGYYIDDANHKKAAVFLDDELLFETEPGTNNFTSSDVVVDKEGDVYWVRNMITSTGEPQYGDIMKNDEIYLNCSLTGSRINKLFLTSNHLYAAGTVLTEYDVHTAKVWMDNDSYPVMSWGDGTTEDYYAEAVFTVEGGNTYVCGYQRIGGARTAYVWKNGSATPEITVSNAVFTDVYVYNGDIYTCGYENWDINATAKVWKNGQVLYTLDQGHAYADDLKVYAGDIYCASFAMGNRAYVWKNGQILQTVEYDGDDARLQIDALDVSTEGVFYSTSIWQGDLNPEGCAIFQNDETIMDPAELLLVEGMDVVSEPCEDVVYTLPYFEGFEMGETTWNCWTVIDGDNNNGGKACYWDRAGRCNEITNVMPKTGDNYARHLHNTLGTAAQEGWLVTPRLSTQVGRNITMTFSSYTEWTFTNGYASVWVSFAEDPTNTDAYEQVWTMPNNGASWQDYTVDLSDYSGLAIYVAFKYEASGGSNSPAWNIDDVNITESWSPCAPVTTFPFEEQFTTNPFVANTCWYMLDVDMDGVQRGWQWDGSLKCAYHPFGQSDEINQEGWMITPTLDIPSGMSCTLSFRTKYDYPEDLGESSVWVSSDKTSVPDPANFTKIWEENNATTEWNTQTINLSSYAGHKVNIAFKYSGIYAHGWYVDNVVVATAVPDFTVTVNVNNPAYGQVFGAGPFQQGATCTLFATAYNGCAFSHWSDGSTDNPYVFVVNSDVTLTAFFSGAGVDEFGTTALNIYPNPAQSTISIEGLEDEAEVSIYNGLGMLVKTLKVNADEEINVSDLAAGLYMIRCGNQTMRFVKE